MGDNPFVVYYKRTLFLHYLAVRMRHLLWWHNPLQFLLLMSFLSVCDEVVFIARGLRRLPGGGSWVVWSPRLLTE